jgi:biopolymer transport protein ExbD
MKLRRAAGDETKVELQMTPMIDVVFQLLVFFLFSFKIVPVEGEVGVNMPPITAGAKPQSDDIELTEKVKIKLRSSDDGRLIAILVGENQIGSSPIPEDQLSQHMQLLTQLLRDSVVGPGGKADDAEVEIDVAETDRHLLYHFVIRVTNAVQRAGIKKINFTDPFAAQAE